MSMNTATAEQAPDLAARFARDGAVWPVTLFEGEEARGLHDRYLAFQAASCRHRGRETYIKPHLVATWLDAIVHHPLVLDHVEAAIGPDILLWSSDFFVKEGGKGSYVSWHQDSPFWSLTPLDKVVSVWLAITPSTRDNGCMCLVPGSHRFGSFGGLETKPEGSKDLLSVRQQIDFAFDETRDPRPVELRPGQFSVHCGLTLHGGSPNPTGSDRIGFVMRYISTDTVQLSADDSALLVRGRDDHGYYLPEARPSGDFTPESLAQLEAVKSRPSGFNDMVVR
jgi:chlorinating enzyme